MTKNKFNPEDYEDERKCPKCFQDNWGYVARNPAADMCQCNDCGHRFEVTEAYIEGKQDPEAGFHNNPKAWSK